ncbi:MAG: hypothetical protein IPJ27_11900 [Candidatus Accumulibacter sp.]|uniref:Uncharacterized protein n=1 Tax=Candidatus Accumulibacter proximus TaxID=2954385 RepID=A0A935UFV0_9PROT|nr:hypothetical protein [Candidatus Accumulibacter proximus]
MGKPATADIPCRLAVAAEWGGNEALCCYEADLVIVLALLHQREARY